MSITEVKTAFLQGKPIEQTVFIRPPKEAILDIGANNYPFQCFLCFLTLKLCPSFRLATINHKMCTLSHNSSHNTEIYLIETFDKTSFQNKVLHPNTGEMKLA